MTVPGLFLYGTAYQACCLIWLLRVTSYESRVTDYESQVTSHESRVTRHG